MIESSDFHLLLDRARQGCEESAAHIFRRYGPRLERLVRRRLKRLLRPVVEPLDVCQEIWAVFFRCLPEQSFTSPRGLFPFLVGICKNKLREAHQRYLDAKKRCRGLQTDLPADLPDERLPVEQFIAAKDEWDALLSSVKPQWRQALALLHDGFSRRQVAATLGVSRRTVGRIMLETRHRASQTVSFAGEALWHAACHTDNWLIGQEVIARSDWAVCCVPPPAQRSSEFGRRRRQIGDVMRKPAAVLLLMLTLAPLVYFLLLVAGIIALIVVRPLSFPGGTNFFIALFIVHAFFMVLGFAMWCFYNTFLLNTREVPAEQKDLWEAVLFRGMLTPIFWYLYLWRPLCRRAGEPLLIPSRRSRPPRLDQPDLGSDTAFLLIPLEEDQRGSERRDIMQFGKRAVVLLLIPSVAPLAYLAFFFLVWIGLVLIKTGVIPNTSENHPDLQLFVVGFVLLTIACMLLGAAMVSFYVVVLFKTKAIPTDQKADWARWLFTRWPVSLPVFWYHFLWLPLRRPAEELPGTSSVAER
jgi:RNA polymerase sigma factor (sigma-70 family)